MNVEHDEEWLATEENYDFDARYSDFTYENVISVAVESAKAYHEHMMRWRPITQSPKSGQWIEVLCNELGDIHSITYGPAQFNETDLGWRPAVALPVIAKEAL